MTMLRVGEGAGPYIRVTATPDRVQPSPGRLSAPQLQRGGALDALRFLASAFIVLFHYGDEAPVRLAQLSSLFDRGYLATDFFLMLSGYVLGRVYGPRLELGRVHAGDFLRRRIQRVWPLHLVCLAALAALVAASHAVGHPLKHAGAYDWSRLPTQAFLMQAWFGGGGLGWNQPSWTLSALIVCYAAFPWLWRAVRRLEPVVVLAMSGVILALAVWLFRSRWNLAFFDLPFGLGVWRALPLFAVGAALARFRLTPPPSARLRLSLAGIAVAGLVALQSLPRTDLFDAMSIALIALAVFAAGSRPPSAPSAVLRRAADLSFALFLTHHFAGALWFAAMHAAKAGASPPPAVAWALWTGGLAFALIVAAVFTGLDERLQRGLAALESRLETVSAGLAAQPTADSRRATAVSA